MQQNGGIKFKNLSEPVSVGTASTTGTAKIEESKSAEINGINVGLSTPGDKVTYTVDLVNEGTINAKIDKIEKTELTSEQQKYLTFKVTDKSGNEVSEGDILSAGETRNLTITVEFIKDLTKEDLPKQTSTISLSYKLNFVQTDEKVTSNSQGSLSSCTSFDKKDNYSVGDEIALCNTVANKSEDFYVIKDNGNTVTALAKYNLLVGDIAVWNDSFSDMISVTPISSSEEGYGLQSSIAANYEWDIEKGLPKTNTMKGVMAFATPDETRRLPNCTSYGCYYGYWTDSSGNLLSKYGTSYPANVFDSNSNLYEPLNNYKSYLKNTLGKTSVQTKLITYEDLVSLGCNSNDNTCTSAPSFVYSTNYWTSSAGDYYLLWFVGSIGGFDYFRYFDGPEYVGLRPVITINKSEL